MFYPKSVAVMGVSPRPGNMATSILGNLSSFDYRGKVYAIGNAEGEIQGQKIYGSLQDVPDDIELAVMLIPARAIPAALEECGRKGVKRAVISSAGFGEFSVNGAEMERQLNQIASKHNIRFIGPNCLGITNLDNGMVIPFAGIDQDRTLRGSSSIIAQSGGVSLRCIGLFAGAGLGVNKVISIGNKLNVDEVDLLEYLSNDPETSAIYMYLEDIKRGRALMDAARQCPKPVVVMKANRSSASATVAKSHTAALASDDRVVDAALRQAGIMRVDNLEDFVACAKAFALPRMVNDNIAVTTSSGGFSVIVADIAEAAGLRMAPLPDTLIARLEEQSRGGIIRFMNPIDLGDVVDRTAAAMVVRELLNSSEFSGMAVTVGSGTGTTRGLSDDASKQLLLDVKAASLETGKPTAITVFGSDDSIQALSKEVDFPIFRTLEEAVEALAIQRRYQRLREAAVS